MARGGWQQVQSLISHGSDEPYRLSVWLNAAPALICYDAKENVSLKVSLGISKNLAWKLNRHR
jgi:hypothetical protein